MTDEQAELVGRTFRHYKGNLYRLEGFAKDSETLEEMVVYRALYGERGLWVRPAKMFFETIERDGRTMKRFEPEGIEIRLCDETMLPQAKALIEEYAKRLGRDLSFQHLAEELADISAKYSPPNGELLVAVERETVVGIVAYHRHSETRCEMKRLYVAPAARGRKLGELLVTAVIEHASRAGYAEMVLDTVKPLKAAIALYKKHGFRECEPYYENPMADVLYMRLGLTDAIENATQD